MLNPSKQLAPFLGVAMALLSILALTFCSDTTGPEKSIAIQEFRVKNLEEGDMWPPFTIVWLSERRLIIKETFSLLDRVSECIRLLPDINRQSDTVVFRLQTERIDGGKCTNAKTVISYIAFVGPFSPGRYTLVIRHNRYASEAAKEEFYDTINIIIK